MTSRRRDVRTRRYLDSTHIQTRTDTQPPLPKGSHGRESEWFSRLIALSNGVFAISLTLLVLNIGISAGTSVESLGQSIVDLVPSFVAFILTVFIVGLYWFNHNSLFNSFRGIDMTLVGFGLVYLALIALIPFPNELLGSHHTEPVSYVIFATLLTCLATVDTSMLAYARRQNLINSRISTRAYRIDLLRGRVTILTFASSVPLSFVLVQWTPIIWLLLLVFDQAISNLK